MLFPSFPDPAKPATEPWAASALVKSLLAYTPGFEDCQIEVETVDGMIMLSGQTPSEIEIRGAVAIAADFTTKPVICRLQVSASGLPPL